MESQNLEDEETAENVLGGMNRNHGTPSSTDSGVMIGDELTSIAPVAPTDLNAEAVIEFHETEENEEKISVDIEGEPFVYRRESKNEAEDPENNSASPSSANDDAPIVSVTCGALNAKLHMDRFMCPGIHQPCVEYEGDFYSPKQFTVVAAKDKQKDWKGSIKIDRVPLRSLMERKQLDFYKHEKYCSGKCASKNYRAMYKDQEFQLCTADFIQQQQQALFTGPMSVGNSGQAPNAFVTMPNFVSDLNLMQATATALVKNEPIRSPTGASDQHSDASGMSSRSARSGSMGNGPLVNDPSILARNFALSALESQANSEKIPGASKSPEGPEALLLEKPFQFWQNVFHLGLFDDLVSEVISQLEQYKVVFGSRPDLREKIADRLSATVRSLDISHHIARTLQTKRILTKAETDLLTNEIEELKRRTDEQKRRQYEAKRKSELFDQLFQKPPKLAKISDN